MDLSIKHLCLWLGLAMSAYQPFPNAALAAGRLDIPLVEVMDLTARPAPLMGKSIGVLAMVLCLDRGHCVIGMSDNTTETVKVDIRRMRIVDQRRLLRQCFYTSCSQILIGVLNPGTFVATAAYDTKLPMLPPKPVLPRIIASMPAVAPAVETRVLYSSTSPSWSVPISICCPWVGRRAVTG